MIPRKSNQYQRLYVPPEFKHFVRKFAVDNNKKNLQDACLGLMQDYLDRNGKRNDPFKFRL